MCNTEPHGSVCTGRPHARCACRPDPQRGPRAPRRRQRDHHRARGAVRDLAHRDEEARAGARGGQARRHREGGPDAPMQPRSAGPGGRPRVDRDLPADAGRTPRPFRGTPRTHERSTRVTSDQQQAHAVTLTTPTNREIHVERVFDAPRDRVFAAFTDPKLIPEWCGPTTTVDQMDVRPGGSWRFVFRNADGSESAFRGTYKKVTPPERLVQTLELGGTPAM